MSSQVIIETNSTAMSHIDCVIKLGGSSLTHKDRKETFNEELFEPTIEAISQVWFKHEKDAGRPLRAVLIHGAGSFGHPHAKAGKVHLGISDEASTSSVQHGFCDTRVGLHKLSTRVLDGLVSRGVPAVLTPVFPEWKTRTVCENGIKKSQEVVQHQCKTLESLVSQGYLPVLHGDCVMDIHQKTAILSGDLILDCVASALRPKYVVYVSDVPGVFDRPPFLQDKSNDPSATIIPEIQVLSDGSFTMPTTSINCADVTGGMAGKLSAAASTALLGVPVFITKGGSEDMLGACLGTPPANGTTIRPPIPEW